MWHLLAAMILATGNPGDDILVRVENWSGCTVRVQVLQRGAVRQTIFVENARTVTERVRIPSVIEPPSFRVVGIGCPFTNYTIEPLNAFETAIVLRLNSNPTFSYLMPLRLPTISPR